MKTSKLGLVLFFTFFSFLGSSTETNAKLSIIEKCKPLLILNASAQSHLNLDDSTMVNIDEINHQYLKARREILDKPDMIGQNTALLSSWDHWRLSLEKHLTAQQIKQFFKWQSEIDLLSKTPY